MKKRNFYILLVILLHGITASAQLDSINYLEEVVLSDIRLYRNSEGNPVRVLRDSVLEENSPFLTSLLRFNSPLYFKENGPGMVSSASFRGTTASQTAVIWNGININSQLNGQTDFNTLLTTNYDNIVVRSGGGSMMYGSGAIGGTVHLNNDLRFNRGFQNKIRLNYGSFDTFLGSYTTTYSTEKFSVQLNLAGYSSDNDFIYPGTEKRNLNGDFQHTGANLAMAYRPNADNILKLYSNYFNGDRGFSGTLTAPSKSKYEDENIRNLLHWGSYLGDFESNLRLAWLDETYKYYENREKENFTYGSAQTGIFKYDLGYRIAPGIKLTALVDLQQTSGEGTNIGDASRKRGSFGLLFEHEMQDFEYEISGRQEITDTYSSAFIYSASAGYDVLPWYGLRFNFSRNYRIPTFNDLFWYAGGNEDLQPETSLQAEVGQEFDLGSLDLDLTAFVIEIDNLLRWVPGPQGLWKPGNTESVRNYGLEAVADWEQNFRNFQLNFSSSYAYTRTRDLVVDKALIYSPKHKATASIAVGRGRISSFFQVLYTGSVYTSSDNAYSLDAYSISNLGFKYALLKSERLTLGGRVENIFNTYYQNMPSRPMQGRSYSFSLTFKF